MSIVREHINEKFVKNSDPVQDLGIGILSKIKEDYAKYIFSAEPDPSLNDLLEFCIEYMKRLNYPFKYIKYLIDKGADVNYNNNILSSIIYSHDKQMLDNFLKIAKNKLNKINKNNAFKEVITNYPADLVVAQKLLDAGANINANNGVALTKLMKYYNNNPITYKPIIKWLLERGVKVSASNYYALRQAIKIKDHELGILFAKQYLKDKDQSI